MKLAVYQGAGNPGNTQENLNVLARISVEAGKQGADLLVFSELFLTGYNIGKDAWELGETSDGASLKRIAEVACEQGVGILIGYVEVDQNHFYNSAALFDSSGTQLANYRKTHLYGSQERHLFQPGNSYAIATIAGWEVGILICYDIEFPEIVRFLAQQGVQLILVPTALTVPTPLVPSALEVAKILVPARALENQIFIAYSNHCGQEGDLTYCGLSCIIGPDGKELQRAGDGEILLIAELEKEAITNAKASGDYLRDFRPRLYQTLEVQSSKANS